MRRRRHFYTLSSFRSRFGQDAMPSSTRGAGLISLVSAARAGERSAAAIDVKLVRPSMLSFLERRSTASRYRRYDDYAAATTTYASPSTAGEEETGHANGQLLRCRRRMLSTRARVCARIGALMGDHYAADDFRAPRRPRGFRRRRGAFRVGIADAVAHYFRRFLACGRRLHDDAHITRAHDNGRPA